MGYTPWGVCWQGEHYCLVYHTSMLSSDKEVQFEELLQLVETTPLCSRLGKPEVTERTGVAPEELFHRSWALNSDLKLLQTTGQGGWRPMPGGWLPKEQSHCAVREEQRHCPGLPG